MFGYLHVWQNDRNLSCATAVALRWNGSRNKSQHRKLTLNKKIIPPLLPGFEPTTFRSRVRPSTTEVSPLPAHTLVSVIHSCCRENRADTESNLDPPVYQPSALQRSIKAGRAASWEEGIKTWLAQFFGSVTVPLFTFTGPANKRVT